MQSTSILTLTSIGIAITLYISISHLLKKDIICPINRKSWNLILKSIYSKTLGIKNEFIGLVYYIIILLSLFITIPTSFMKTTSSLAAFHSIILFGIQVKLIKSYCFWCICTAIINILLFVLIVNA